jgi:peptidoglycan/LPS O-acetylase OafA/YrhL
MLSYVAGALRSYSIYPSHSPVFIVVERFVPGGGPAHVIEVVIVVLIAAVTWRFVEQPLIRYGHRRLRYV